MQIDSVVAYFAILLALSFDFVNGFHDTANAVATIIYTKSLPPGIAIGLSGILNFLGALFVGTAVAQVITKIIPPHTVTLPIVVAVLIAALIWNLLTWWFCIPVSSSHCLIASLFGAGVAAAGINGVDWHELWRVIIALLVSPIIGFIAGAIVTSVALIASGEKNLNENAASKSSDELVAAPHRHPAVMRWLHVLASASVSFSHGSNDGQKTMGIITLILATHFAAYGYTLNHVPFWVMAAAALAISLGTVIGGWRIIQTVGTKISHEALSDSQGFGASLSTAIIILVASHLGAPISTTHTLSSAVAGGTIPVYGAAKLNLKTMKLIAAAWILTIPVAAFLAALSFMILRAIFHT